jgi:hypothetical protein
MKTVKKSLLSLAALLSACAGPQVLPNYPKHETAVVTTYTNNLGFKGLFASEGTRTVSTRADMRRTEDEFAFSGFVMKHLAKARDGARIRRLDKRLLWDLDLAAKTYTECPLSGCPAPKREAPAEKKPERRPEQPQKKPSCKLTMTKNSFTVKATGQTKNVNGFDAKEYQVAWDVVAQDKDKNKDTSSVAVSIWTTSEDDPRIKAVRAVERRFESALRGQLPEESAMNKAIPADALKIIELEFMNNFSAGQRSALLNAGRELAKIHGLPVSTTLNWYLDGNACQTAPAPQEKQERSSQGLDFSRGLGGLLGSAASGAAQKGVENQAKGMAGKPVFGFVEELKAMKVEPASDGLFVPPPGFKLAGRR